MEYFIHAFKNFSDFNSRTSRKEYWMFYLFYMIFYTALAVLDGLLGSIWLSSVFAIALCVPSISITARRLHDTGRSGWWQLIMLVPLIGWIVLLVFLAQDSKEENQYGINPKMAPTP